MWFLHGNHDIKALSSSSIINSLQRQLFKQSTTNLHNNNMAVQVEPAAIQVPASGGNVSLQLMNGNPEVSLSSSNLLLLSSIHLINNILFLKRSASPSSSSPAITSTTESTPSSDSWSPVPLPKSKWSARTALQKAMTSWKSASLGLLQMLGTPRPSSLLDLRASSRSTFLWLLHEYGSGTMDG